MKTEEHESARGRKLASVFPAGGEIGAGVPALAGLANRLGAFLRPT